MLSVDDARFEHSLLPYPVGSRLDVDSLLNLAERLSLDQEAVDSENVSLTDEVPTTPHAPQFWLTNDAWMTFATARMKLTSQQALVYYQTFALLQHSEEPNGHWTELQRVDGAAFLMFLFVQLYHRLSLKEQATRGDEYPERRADLNLSKSAPSSSSSWFLPQPLQTQQLRPRTPENMLSSGGMVTSPSSTSSNSGAVSPRLTPAPFPSLHHSLTAAATGATVSRSASNSDERNNALQFLKRHVRSILALLYVLFDGQAELFSNGVQQAQFDSLHLPLTYLSCLKYLIQTSPLAEGTPISPLKWMILHFSRYLSQSSIGHVVNENGMELDESPPSRASLKQLEDWLYCNLSLKPYSVSTFVSSAEGVITGIDNNSRDMFQLSPSHPFRLILTSKKSKTVLIQPHHVPLHAHLRIHKCHYAYIYVLAPVRHVTVSDCSHTVVVIGACSGVLHVHHCDYVTVHASCSQPRVSLCKEVALYVSCTAMPLIWEPRNSGVVFAPLDFNYPLCDEHRLQCGLRLDDRNIWDCPVRVWPTVNEDVMDVSNTTQAVVRLLPVEAFCIFSVPFVLSNSYSTSLPETVVPLPLSFQQMLDARRRLTATARQLIAQGTSQQNSVKDDFVANIESRFRQWLDSTGNVVELASLAELQRAMNVGI